MIEIRADTVKQAVRDEPDRIRWIAAQPNRLARLVGAGGRILGASDQTGSLTGRASCQPDGLTSGVERDRHGPALSRIPGRETSRGLGWHGLKVQTDPSAGSSGTRPA
ncbi:hypothetical protein [Methylobacterium sp. 1973]|uniref:hypothetical protein n=1 Tax=Methylobacterium sp. 1973 TaxID=3156421 RepID=UPI0006AF023A|nr:hypothetical protein ADL19_26370 [Streptomyces purpurogeneiscleroticus]